MIGVINFFDNNNSNKVLIIIYKIIVSRMNIGQARSIFNENRLKIGVENRSNLFIMYKIDSKSLRENRLTELMERFNRFNFLDSFFNTCECGLSISCVIGSGLWGYGLEWKIELTRKNNKIEGLIWINDKFLFKLIK